MIRLILITIREARLILQRFNASHKSEFKYFWATHAAMGELRAPLRERALEARGHKFPCPATVKGKNGRRMGGQASAIKPYWLSCVWVIIFHMEKGWALSASLGL